MKRSNLAVQHLLGGILDGILMNMLKYDTPLERWFLLLQLGSIHIKKFPGYGVDVFQWLFPSIIIRSFKSLLANDLLPWVNRAISSVNTLKKGIHKSMSEIDWLFIKRCFTSNRTSYRTSRLWHFNLLGINMSWNFHPGFLGQIPLRRVANWVSTKALKTKNKALWLYRPDITFIQSFRG